MSIDPKDLFFSGVISSLKVISQAGASAKIVGAIMMVIGFIFGLNAAADIVMLIKVDRKWHAAEFFFLCLHVNRLM